MSDILAKYYEQINSLELNRRRALLAEAEASRQAEFERLLNEVKEKLSPNPSIFPSPFPCPWEVRDGAVRVELFPALNADERETLLRAVRGLMPWRKGPFAIGDLYINAEWRSDFKWDRLASALPSLAGKRIADVGCGNGYYLFRLLERCREQMSAGEGDGGQQSREPECIIGFDPSQRCYYQFELLKYFFAAERLQFERLVLDDVEVFGEFFDLTLCWGVIYHRQDPLSALKKLVGATAPGGVVIVESQGIPGSEPVALFPPGRYGKLRNVFFVPTASCLKAWMERSGLVDVEVFSVVATSSAEQRRTEFSPDESLSDFLDAHNPQLTVEGWPAPLRIAARGMKP